MGLDPAGREMPIFAVSLARFAVSFKEEKGDYIGRDALAAQKDGTEKRVVPIALLDRGVMRAGMDVYHNGTHAGWVTSGTMVPYCNFGEDGTPLETTGKRSIGFAYLSAGVGADDVIEIDVRGKRLRAKRVERHIRQDCPPYARPVLL